MNNKLNIRLRLDHNVVYVDGNLRGDIYKRFKRALGYLPENSMWMIESVKRKREKEQNLGKLKYLGEWDGWITTVCYNKEHCKCFTPKSGTHFPTGLFSKAKQFFEDNNIGYQFEDIRSVFIPKKIVLSMSSKFEMRDYQLDVVKKALKQTRGIIKMATGSGKTPVASCIISYLSNFPTIFYVTSKDLLYQAKNELEKFILKNGKNIEVGIVGDSKKDIKDITVMTIQTAVKALGGTYKKFDNEERSQQIDDFYKNDNEVIELIRSARVMICDEVQHWASESCQMISDVSEKCQHRFAFSATPWRDKGDDILIDACFGKCIADVSASFLIKKGYLVKPEILFVHIDNMNKGKYKTYANYYKYGIVNNELRNNWIRDMAIVLQKDNRNTLILCKQIKHGKILESLIPNSFFIHGSHSKKKRLEHLEKMRNQEAKTTISSVIFDEGIDVRPLDSLILAGSGESQTRALQRIGRILRTYKNKKNAIVVDFFDNCKYLRNHSETRRKIYSTESEFVIKDAYVKE